MQLAAALVVLRLALDFLVALVAAVDLMAHTPVDLELLVKDTLVVMASLTRKDLVAVVVAQAAQVKTVKTEQTAQAGLARQTVLLVQPLLMLAVEAQAVTKHMDEV
jgi:hypothetical protein